MQLVRIEHNRCDEYDCETFGWVPNDWTEEQFEEAVERAEKAYLEAYYEWKRIKDKAPENLYPHNRLEFYNNHPNLTVKRAKEMFEEVGAKRKAWEQEYNKGRRTFMDFLSKEGVTPFSEIEPVFSTDIYWGHRHGDDLEYQDDSPRKDLPGPVAWNRGGIGLTEHDWLGKEGTKAKSKNS